MRALRWFVVSAVIGAVLAIPTGATANGGAYIDFDRTHYLPGETVIGETYVYVPERKQGLLERGPFYAYVLPRGTSIREGRPIPGSAIRVGTFSIEKERREEFELRVSFTVPDLAGDFYSIMACNDPCTISGFREPLTGTISVVRTVREGQLISQQWRLEGRIYGLRRDVRKADRSNEELQAQLETSELERSNLATQVDRLELELAGAAAAEEPATRPLIDSWAAIVVALLALAGALAIRRLRSARILVPDTIEELDREMEGPARR
ncbi:MAG: hypothetical protein ACRDH0_03495 [Actinomycetota bacterium]